MVIDTVPVPLRTFGWTIFFSIGLPMLITLIAMLAVRQESALKWTLIVGAISAPHAIGLLWVLTRNEIRIAPESLIIKAGLYDLSLARTELVAGQCKVLDRREAGELAPTLRLNGIGLPGYQAGWFRLRNGEKAFQLVTADKVVILPTTRGYRLIVSPRDPEQFWQGLGVSCR